MNKITITGRLTRDPDLRRTQSGKAVCNINVAVKRPFMKDETDFIDCVLWEQRAEFVSKYFSKGSFIIISGSLQSRDYEDKDGNKRRAWEIKVDDAEFGGSKNDGGDADRESQRSSGRKSSSKKNEKDEEQSAPASDESGEDDELPF